MHQRATLAGARCAPSARRGFSLIELLVAVAIGTAGIAAASYVARMAVRGASRGSQVGQTVLNTQVIARQVRGDLEIAGYGSTGAVGANPALGGLIAPLARGAGLGAGRNALPVIRTADNVGGATIRGTPVMNGSDILQLIVPDPGRASTTLQPVPVNTSCTGMNALLDPATSAQVTACPLRFIADHTSANGAGRTQLIRCAAGAVDNTLFDLAPGADVMCARWSTYWVDNQLQLHRSDFDPTVGTTPAAGLAVPGGGAATDVIAPGVADLQVAVRVSSAVAGVNTALNSWVYSGPTGRPSITNADWFEVRQARITLIFRTLRAVDDDVNTALNVPDGIENRPPGTLAATLTGLRATGTSRAYRFVRMTTSEVLHNQRFFDLNLPTGVPADPY